MIKITAKRELYTMQSVCVSFYYRRRHHFFRKCCVSSRKKDSDNVLNHKRSDFVDVRATSMTSSACQPSAIRWQRTRKRMTAKTTCWKKNETADAVGRVDGN